jgi:exopolyphosphatase / guanosine-5'-triphosphate,3'-diphosphate pyrophosphatase
MRIAVLDIGSNTAHALIVDGQPDGSFEPVAQRREVLRLADAAFPSMTVPDAAADRLVATITELRDFAGQHAPGALVAFATSAIREATNGMAVLGRVRDEAGVPVRVLPGSEEARLTYLAARAWATFSARRLLVLDIGGGSLEVAGGEGEQPGIAESLPLGASRLTRRFVLSDPPAADELAALRVHCLRVLGPLAERIREQHWDVVCATSKTFRTLARAADTLPQTPSPSRTFGFAGIDGRTAPVLAAETVNVLAGHLARTTRRERNRIKGMDQLRVGTLIAGSQLAALAMQAFGLARLVLAPWALREGVIIELLRRELAGAGPQERWLGHRHAAVLAFAHRHAWDEPHSRLVTELAVSLFDQTRHLHRRGQDERELLYFSGLLHDVGCAVAQSAHHKHSLYIIANAEIEGFDQRELRLMANIARYHRKALPADHHLDYMSLAPEDRRLVRQLGALLRLADGLDLDHSQLVEAVTIVENIGGLALELRARDEPKLARWAIERLGDLFELEYGISVRPAAGTN